MNTALASVGRKSAPGAGILTKNRMISGVKRTPCFVIAFLGQNRHKSTERPSNFSGVACTQNRTKPQMEEWS